MKTSQGVVTGKALFEKQKYGKINKNIFSSSGRQQFKYIELTI